MPLHRHLRFVLLAVVGAIVASASVATAADLTLPVERPPGGGEVLLTGDAIAPPPPVGAPGGPTHGPGAGCAPDTVLFSLARATGLQGLNINDQTSAQAGGQYFDPAGEIEVLGADFYAYVLEPPATIEVSVELYAADADKLPTGPALATRTIAVSNEIGDGTLEELRQSVSFDSPVALSTPFVLAVANRSATPMGLIASDWIAGDGSSEWLASADLFGTWTSGEFINIGGFPLDADFLFEPVVQYTPTAAFSVDPLCFPGATTVSFANASSTPQTSRFLDQVAFSGETPYLWDYDDGSESERAVDPVHAFADGGPFDVRLTATSTGWTRTCGVEALVSIGQEQCPCATGLVSTFASTGAVQHYRVPGGVTSVSVEATGAQGESAADGGAGGRGGFAAGSLDVTPGELLEVRVGGPDGFNGGGAAGASGTNVSGAGGGASDVRAGGSALAARVIVGGGGGGGSGAPQGTCAAGGPGADGAAGGSIASGGAGVGCSSPGGAGGDGGDQAAGGTAGAAGAPNASASPAPGIDGALGLGGDGGDNSGFASPFAGAGGGGGGGGYFGGGGGGGGAGGAGGAWGGGGGGGSSYVGGVFNGVSLAGQGSGEGIVRICHAPLDDFPYVVPQPLASVEGNGSDSAPLGDSVQRMQLAISSSLLSEIPVGSRIEGLTFRVQGGESAVPAQEVANYEIRLSQSSVEPELLGATFADNRGADEVIVRSGPLSIGAGRFPGGESPNAFGEPIGFTEPYIFAGGPLLLEVAHDGFPAGGRSADIELPLTGDMRAGFGTGFDASEADLGLFDTGLIVELHGSWSLFAGDFESGSPCDWSGAVSAPQCQCDEGEHGSRAKDR